MVEDILIIGIACDHAGYKLKLKILEKFTKKRFQFKDYGTHSDKSMDYPDVIHTLAKDIDTGKLVRGIIICGSGNGVAMTANKYRNIRAALCWKPEIARFARLHNDANILSLPARFIEASIAINITEIFLTTGFENGRHGIRVKKIPPSNE